MNESIAKRFLESQENHAAIKSLRSQNLISQKECDQAMFSNMVLYENEWWCLGKETDKWHVFRGNVWVQSIAPHLV